MLAREDNERVTRVGRGTPMGEAMRRYWIPALLAWELPSPIVRPARQAAGRGAGGVPRYAGRIGLLDERCPHRQASLFLGRNEDCGLRCVYHGWKFDVDGRCVDMMNEPEELRFEHKIRTGAYPTVEAGGIIWAYLGPRSVDRAAAFRLDPGAPSHRHVSKVIQESNWLQGLEGGIDTSHVPSCIARLALTLRAPASSRAIPSWWARRPRSSSTSRTTATGMPACGARGRGEAYPRLSLDPALPSDPSRPHRRGQARLLRCGRPHLGPMDDGPPWSTTGSRARRSR